MFGFDHITFNPDILGGKACICGLRISVSLIVNLVANGLTTAEILTEYPDLEIEDIQQALRYAAWTTEETVYIPAGGGGYQSSISAALISPSLPQHRRLWQNVQDKSHATSNRRRSQATKSNANGESCLNALAVIACPIGIPGVSCQANQV
jgi:uncharacterized protein (DUF433 family)